MNDDRTVLIVSDLSKVVAPLLLFELLDGEASK